MFIFDTHMDMHSNIAVMRNQLKTLGLGFNWDGELRTCDSSYYKWTQVSSTALMA